MTEKQYIVSCPFCGCKVINERNSGVVYFRVTKWIVEMDGDYVYADDYAPGVWQGEQDLESLIPAYECNDCYRMFDTPNIEDAEEIMKRSKKNE